MPGDKHGAISVHCVKHVQKPEQDMCQAKVVPAACLLSRAPIISLCLGYDRLLDAEWPLLPVSAQVEEVMFGNIPERLMRFYVSASDLNGACCTI